MFIRPCRRNVNVWHVLAALIWGTEGFWSCAISERRGFAWFYNINTAKAGILCNTEGAWQGEQTGGGNFFLIITLPFCFKKRSTELLLAVFRNTPSLAELLIPSTTSVQPLRKLTSSTRGRINAHTCCVAKLCSNPQNFILDSTQRAKA